ncbi:MAG: hypothetical protein IPJ06_13555 [Saprospiraceae bacterium]|nr:hypothetical protein [Saprospiraceae bacterium]
MSIRFSLFFTIIFLSLSTPSIGQLRQILHTSIPGDSLLAVHMDLQDSYSVHLWQNSAIFIESEIVLATCRKEFSTMS